MSTLTARFPCAPLLRQGPWNHAFYLVLDAALPPTPVALTLTVTLTLTLTLALTLTLTLTLALTPTLTLPLCPGRRLRRATRDRAALRRLLQRVS